ncbi:hypothetical protein D210916BOD24_05060 [Alteromonas sp. D210916BOD_24]|uniref:ABC transporter permease subunit n=1 Tax=Alteromonas sp. D210916BOD_24 TaxID=3157618 RepID=UPI00399CC4DB
MTFDSDSINKTRQRKDRWSRYVVTGFGGLVLLTLVILISHLISQALPLAYIPSLEPIATYRMAPGEKILSTGDVLNGQPLLVKKADCRISLQLLSDNELVSHHDYIRPCEYQLTTRSVMGENFIVDISPNGQVRILPVRAMGVEVRENQREMNFDTTQNPLLSTMAFALPKSMWEQRHQWDIALSTHWIVVAIKRENRFFVRWVNRKKPTQIIDKVYDEVDSLILLPGSESVIVVKGSNLYSNRLKEGAAALSPVATNVLANTGLVTLFPLAKDRTFFLSEGQTSSVTRWVLTQRSPGLAFKATYQINLRKGESVSDIAEHASMNLVAILTDKQRILLVNRVSGDVVKTLGVNSAATNLIWYGNKLYGRSETSLSVWDGKNLSGITTWSSLFKPQHYEGYDTAETVWQTTSATDFQEAKFSLTPLLIGSIKASLLALVIAIPVAIGAAVYTAYFAKSKLRNIVKPAIELLEAIPSVLIGFIAAIWLSPKAEQFLFSFAFFLIVIPFILIGIAVIQRPFAERLPKQFRHGAELFFAVSGVFVLGYVSVEFAPQLIFNSLGIDGFALLAAESSSPVGKTTIVVALALGVAISPSIYSLAEDAINGVPNELKHASFALGATRLQTLLHVVLHVALPGIVAAIMLGFGRAFGETMIVLMVTGNTPISSWGLIEGLRALTANLAIELPEADVSSAHYQILFFTACILFVFTFLVNTVAEVLRQRIRSKA